MPVQRNLTGKQFGPKIKELLSLIEKTKDWEKYVNEETKVLINTLNKNKNMTETLEELDLKYVTARARLMNALDRISNKKTEYLRNGKSKKAQELFILMKIPNWKEYLTDKEIQYAELFKEHKNLNEVARIMRVAPSNVSKLLYGDNQYRGAVNKIKNGVK